MGTVAIHSLPVLSLCRIVENLDGEERRTYYLREDEDGLGGMEKIDRPELWTRARRLGYIQTRGENNIGSINISRSLGLSIALCSKNQPVENLGVILPEMVTELGLMICLEMLDPELVKLA